MNIKFFYTSIMLFFIVLSTRGMEIDQASLMIPARLSALKLFHEKNKFSVECNGIRKDIQACWVDPTLRKMNSDQLKRFLSHGYIQVKELKGNKNSDYKLDACGRIKGGGPLSFLIVQTVGRPIGYAVVYCALLSGIIPGGTTAPLVAEEGMFAAEEGVEATINSIAAAAGECPFLP